MSALFPRWTSSVAAGLTMTVVLAVGLGVGAAWAYVRSPFNTGEGEPRDQPIAFDHRHHVLDAGIDCRYCHFTVETTPHAGIPSTELCMNCHAQIWTSAAQTDPIRVSYFENRPIVWNRVNALPDHVQFNHAIHVAQGVGCERCHGDVASMTRVAKAHTLTMDFCLDCHRDPGPELQTLHPPTNCSACHR